MKTKILIWILFLGLLLINGCEKVEICDYSRNCESTFKGIGSPPCCREVGLIKDFNFTIINECCYPLECPQSRNNPKECICEYMVKCEKLKGDSDEN